LKSSSEEIFGCTSRGLTHFDEAVRKRICSGEERAGRRRAAGFRGPVKGPAGVQWANPLSSWFLPGDIRMLEGAARNIATDRAEFLGSHPGSRSPTDRSR